MKLIFVISIYSILYNSCNRRQTVRGIDTTLRGPGAGERKALGSGGFGDEFESVRGCVGQRLGLLSRELETLAEGAGSAEVEDEGEDLHLGTAERAQQRVDLVDAVDELRPAEPGASGELVLILPLCCLGDVAAWCGLAALAASRVDAPMSRGAS